ncbi:hypothetical protein K432DRAFT_408824 [Lepidopterella palustris CBS 459.81]|uniref:Uncharacterized protein n=1 Tax=Lepidopterella palustris CBS 459.81 TaxID=1314670 RepID=A0A8E2E1J9_9PEZI|nr:hypothetical protein K432DRAFT_408824 [Lepidopterella palustris CBS 459.81]
MGTNGLLGFIIAGRRRASYNHYDSYPTGLGENIMKFILGLNAEQKAIMVQRLQQVFYPVQPDPSIYDIRPPLTCLDHLVRLTDLQTDSRAARAVLQGRLLSARGIQR